MTAVVCTHDRAEFLPECLASVAADLDRSDELIVVESGDSRAGDAVATLAGVRTRHIRLRDCPKTSKANMAVRLATNEVLVFTDDDCRVGRGWTNAMTMALADQRAGIAFGPVQGLDHVPGGLPAPRVLPGPAPVENWSYAHGASMAARATAVRDVGGFDERLGPGAVGAGEEPDLVVRMAERGWGCVVAEAPPVRHLDWRSREMTAANVLVYERGSGAWLGAGLRRAPLSVAKLLLLRLHYQAELWTDRRARGVTFGPRTTAAFFGGLAHGLTYRPQRWL